jgi:hypothetical protein
MRQLLHDLDGMKTLTRFIARDQRATVLNLERQVRQHADLVDGFYALLGERNWIFHDDMDLSVIEGVVAYPAEQAERALIDSYKHRDTMRFKVRRLGRFPELRARMPLLERAEEDFYDGRYYATVLTLLSVMDGFVNDLDRSERKGLHTRQADELRAWDSVVGHHLGLTHAHKSFVKTFRKRSDDVVTELYRNGIVHGMLPNFDNDTVAAKAWNRMFAIADWATSRVKEATPPKPKPTLTNTLRGIAKNAETRRALDAWRPSTVSATEAGFETDEVVALSITYLDALRSGNYGGMARLLSPLIAESSIGKTAGIVREAFAGTNLVGFQITKVEHSAAAVALVDADLSLGSGGIACRLRWVRSGKDGLGVAPNEEGSWRLVTWSLGAMQSEWSGAEP